MQQQERRVIFRVFDQQKFEGFHGAVEQPFSMGQDSTLVERKSVPQFLAIDRSCEAGGAMTGSTAAIFGFSLSGRGSSLCQCTRFALVALSSNIPSHSSPPAPPCQKSSRQARLSLSNEQ